MIRKNIDHFKGQADIVFHNADFTSSTKLIKMFTGVDTLLLTIDYSIKFNIEHYKNIIKAAKTSKTKNILFISPFSLCNYDEYVDIHLEIEDLIIEQDFSFTTIKYNLTFQDFLKWNPGLKENDKNTQNELFFPLSSKFKVSFCDMNNICELINMILNDMEQHGGKGLKFHFLF